MTPPLALIIEDNERLADIFSITMGQVGFETEIINEGQSAIARLEGSVPSLIILDLHLPLCSGEEILTQIKAKNHFSAVKIILATADSLNSERLRNKVDAVLLKPINPIQLRTLATQLCNVD